MWYICKIEYIVSSPTVTVARKKVREISSPSLKAHKSTSRCCKSIRSVPNDRYCHDLQFVFSSWFCISKISMSNLSVKTCGPVAPDSVTLQWRSLAAKFNNSVSVTQWGRDSVREGLTQSPADLLGSDQGLSQKVSLFNIDRILWAGLTNPR